MYIADTNVLSELMKDNPSRSVIDWFWDHEGDIYTTAVTVEELYYGLLKMPEGKRRTNLQECMDAIVKDCAGKTFPFDGFSAYLCAKMRVEALASGHNPSLEDLMIAAITERHNATLATRNVKDFDYLGITLVNPFEPD